jgi:glycosyltransferase involved in cell wall biosynthesis
LKILHLIQTKQLRGAEIFTCQLSNHLQQMGHKVKIAALKDGEAVLPFEGAIEVLNANFNNRFWDWKAWKQLSKLIEEFEPAIVQANAGDTLKYAILSKLFFRWKQPVVFRNASTMSHYIRNGFVKWLNKQLLSRAAHIASVSDFTKNDLEEQLQVPSKKVTVLPTGIEQTTIQSIEMDQSCRHIVHVGGFSFEKNHEGLLRIFQQVLKDVPHTKLWLIGDGKLRTGMEEQVKQLHLQGSVFFKGTLSNPLDFIASADVLVLPSILEGLPAVVLEAFYCKTPVVAYNAGGISELVNNNTGWLISKHDEINFAKQLVQLLLATDSLTVTAKTDAAYEMVTTTYMNNTIAKGFENLYEQMIRA